MRLALYVLNAPHRHHHPQRTPCYALQTMSPDVFFNRSVNTCQENLPLTKQRRSHGGPTHNNVTTHT